MKKALNTKSFIFDDAYDYVLERLYFKNGRLNKKYEQREEAKKYSGSERRYNDEFEKEFLEALQQE